MYKNILENVKVNTYVHDQTYEPRVKITMDFPIQKVQALNGYDMLKDDYNTVMDEIAKTIMEELGFKIQTKEQVEEIEKDSK